ncbi:hypothetical protein G6F70_002037 [Rhizopus microsporus]|nr:hypothetical protein G6F71_004611 [Rhizopus microsporus]KAG1202712.1 hypothetical protein G6F70_002037 [Rhizopus microsporus]KAG1211578.1 hypothetical protein G6F69_004463 [Rhizopus microsporus]KAG1238706.1 hypothetical protein G6F67_000181 [Rhizopus microsporus]KAG1260762.1 hypothetical protein G6F68_007190 [Rhizopus microsporus]
MSEVKGIGSFGSTALLVSSMTGPGLSTIPPLFQQSGWVAPVFIFIILAILSGCSALFVCEALSNIKGNEKFQSKVELTTIAQVYLGKKYHYVFQILLYLALQAVNVASIILAAQTFDSMFITIFKGTCGLGVSPGGWFCVSNATGAGGNSPFPSEDYYIFTFGFLLTAVLVIPLGFFSLVENIAIQMTSFIILTAIITQWCVAFCQEGLKPELLPASGDNSTMVLGIVIFNYSYITTIPSWVNSLKPNVNIHKCMWISVAISTIFYLVLGVLGAMAYQMTASSDILSILSQNGSTASLVTAYLFPVSALVTSIPIMGNILVKLSAMDSLHVCNTSTVNFILPFILYFVSRKYEATVEPIVSDNDDQDLKSTSPIPPHLKSPSSAIKHPDDNDVRMYNPEDNYSISIRRSSIKHSRASHVENSVIVYSPNMDKSMVPAIIYSDVASIDDQKGSNILNSPGSKPITHSPNGHLKPLHPNQSLSTPSSNTVISQSGAINGLGISHPTYENDRLTKNTKESSPQLPRSTLSPTSAPNSPPYMSPKYKHKDGTSPNIDMLAVPTTPEISHASTPGSPSIRSFRRSSMLTSALSFRSSVVAPEGTAVIHVEKKEDGENDDRFIAFKTTRWFNPFYLAIVVCTALTIAIVFMIIYDLVMLGRGDDVFA